MKIKKQLYYSFLINGILFIFFYLFIGSSFITNDDSYMMLTASGFFTGHPEPYLIYTNIIIGYILKTLYSLFPKIPWYGLYQITTLYFSLSIFFYILIDKLSNFKQSLILYLFFILLTASVFMYNLQFTIIAIIATIVGFLSLFYEFFYKKRYDPLVIIVSGILIVIGSMIRFKSFILGAIIAIIGIITYYIIFTDALRYKYNNFFFSYLALLVILSSLLHFIDVFLYNNNKLWSKFIQANKVKAEIIDYRILLHNKTLKNQVFTTNSWDTVDYELYTKMYFLDTNILLNKKSQYLILNSNYKSLSLKIAKNKILAFLHTQTNLIKDRFFRMFILSFISSLIFVLFIIKKKLKNFLFITLYILEYVLIILVISVIFKPSPPRVWYGAFVGLVMTSLIILDLELINSYTFLAIGSVYSFSIYAPSIYYKNVIKNSFSIVLNKLPKDKIYIIWRAPGFKFINPLASYESNKKIIMCGNGLSKYYRYLYYNKYLENNKFLKMGQNIIFITPLDSRNDIKNLEKFYFIHYKEKVKFKELFNNGFFKGFYPELKNN